MDTGKKILIVTGSNYTPQVYQAFYDTKALGHTLYLLSDGSFEPETGVFEKHFTYDLRKTNEVLEYMKKQLEHFDAVTIKTSEWLTPLTALLAKEYGCIGNDPKIAFYCRSKYHMRKKLQEHSIPGPKFRLCKNFEELQKAIEEIGIPCVAKPVGGNASYGTFMIRSREDWRELQKNFETSIEYLKKKAIRDDVFAFDKEEMDLIGIDDHVDMVTDYLVEEYMEGPEISIDAVTQNGITTMMGIADQVRMAPPYFVQIEEKMPYVCDKKTYETIKTLVEETITAMGIKNSSTHTEIIFTNEGPKIVEIACRIGGDNIHDFVYQITGFNLMFESIMIALGEQRNYKIENRCHMAMQYLLPWKSGKITKLYVPDSVKNDPDVTEIEITEKEGNYVSTPPENFDFIGYISVKAPTPEKADTKLKDTVSKIGIGIG